MEDAKRRREKADTKQRLRLLPPLSSLPSSTDDSLASSLSPSPTTSDFDTPPLHGFPFSGITSFCIRGGLAAANTFTTARLFTLAESLGGVESLAVHPAQMEHGSIPPKGRELLKIGEGLIRLSVDVEEREDLVRDVVEAVRVTAGTH